MSNNELSNQLDYARRLLLREQGKMMLLSRTMEKAETRARELGCEFPEGLEENPVQRWIIAVEFILEIEGVSNE